MLVPACCCEADNLQSLSEGDVRLPVEEEALEVVDMRTDIEVELEGPALWSRRARRARMQYPRSC